MPCADADDAAAGNPASNPASNSGSSPGSAAPADSAASTPPPAAGAVRLICRWASAPLKTMPGGRAEMASQILRGEQAEKLEEVALPPHSRERGWLRVRLLHDGYEGYAPREAFDLAPDTPPSHVVCVPQTLLFPQADIKSAPTQPLFMGALLHAAGVPVAGRGTSGHFLPLQEGGFVFAAHVHRLGDTMPADAAGMAEMLLHAPYLWGGRTMAGIDCSGLVQLALTMAGQRNVPRDSGPQAEQVGEALPLSWLQAPERLQRGDLVFWKGHVAMLLDEHTIIHANAHHMQVATEPLQAAVERIARSGGGEPTALRRLPATAAA